MQNYEFGKSTRDAFAEAIMKLGVKNRSAVVINGDSAKIAKTNLFNKYNNERDFNLGLSYSDAIGLAAGLAIQGKIPFLCNLAVFATSKDLEQIRNTICYPNLNVKIIGIGSGLSVGEEGIICQTLEDVGIMRGIPNMKVFCPSDEIECKKIMDYIAYDFGPAYIRVSKLNALKILEENSTPFQAGKGNIIKEGKDIAIISNGTTIGEALKAGDMLEKENISIEIINMASIKPIDSELIIKTAKKVSLIFTVEDHNIINGLGSAVCEIVSEFHPCKVIRIGIPDKFGEIGTTDQLYEKFGLDAKGIYQTIKKHS